MRLRRRVANDDGAEVSFARLDERRPRTIRKIAAAHDGGVHAELRQPRFEPGTIERTPARFVHHPFAGPDLLALSGEQHARVETNRRIGLQCSDEFRTQRLRRYDGPAKLHERPPAKLRVGAVTRVKTYDVDDGTAKRPKRIQQAHDLRYDGLGTRYPGGSVCQREVVLHVDREQSRAMPSRTSERIRAQFHLLSIAARSAEPLPRGTRKCRTSRRRLYTRRMLALLVLGLAPYTGPVLPGSVPGTSKFGVSVSGTPGTTVELRAVGVPKGYVASFCTSRVCAPFHVSLALPQSGRQRIELQLIKNDPDAQGPRSVTVRAGRTATATIAFSRGTN